MPTEEELKPYRLEFEGIWHCVVPRTYSYNIGDLNWAQTKWNSFYELAVQYQVEPRWIRGILRSWIAIYRLVKEGKFKATLTPFENGSEPTILTLDQYADLIPLIVRRISARYESMPPSSSQYNNYMNEVGAEMNAYVMTATILDGDHLDRFHRPDISVLAGHELFSFLNLTQSSFNFGVPDEDKHLFTPVFRSDVDNWMVDVAGVLYWFGYVPNGDAVMLFTFLYRHILEFLNRRLYKRELMPSDGPPGIESYYRLLTSTNDMCEMFGLLLREIQLARVCLCAPSPNGLIPTSIRLVPYQWFIDFIECNYITKDDRRFS
jgi:hypothetical protein